MNEPGLAQASGIAMLVLTMSCLLWVYGSTGIML